MKAIRFASTVLVLRETKQNTASQVQVYTIKRPDTMKFLPGFTVFPGGAVDEDDTSGKWEALIQRDIGKYPLLAQNPDSRLPINLAPAHNSEIAHVVAAIREVFEETGALICQTGSAYLTPQHLAPYREALERKEITFYDMIQVLPIQLDIGRLLHIGTRITPPDKPIRFHTQFYVTFVSNELTMLPSTHEVAADAWIDPVRAEELWERQEIFCVNPTKDCFRSLSRPAVQKYLLRALSS